MARFRPIDSDIWCSDTIQSYNVLQQAIFFFYHTRKEVTESGIYKVSLSQDCRLFRLPIEDDDEPNSHISAQDLEQEIGKMSENLIYDSEKKLIFAVQFLEHNGFKRGNPNLIGKSVLKDMMDYPETKLWNTFIKVYPMYSNTFSKVSSIVSQQMERFVPSFDEKELSKVKILDNSTSCKESKNAFCSFDFEQSISKVLPNYFNSLGILSSKSKSKSFLGDKSAREEPFFGHKCLISAFQQFIEFLANNNAKPTEASIDALAKNLHELSDGDIDTANSILQYSLQNHYKKLFPPKQDAAQKPSQKKKNQEQIHQERVKAIEALIAKSSLESKEMANVIAMYASEFNNPSQYTLKFVTNNDNFDEFCKWLNLQSGDRGLCERMLSKLGVSVEDCTAIFHHNPKLSSKLLQEKISLIPKTSKNRTQSLFKILGISNKQVNNSSILDKTILHPLLKKAHEHGLNSKEYQQLPFLYKDLVQKQGELYTLKT